MKPSPAAKPWVIYTRVSTKDQAERGASLEAQLAACQASAAAHQLQTIHIADEGESAGEVQQPGIAKIRALVESGKVAGVLVYKLDRIARNTRGLLDLVDELRAHGASFTSVQERIDTSGASGVLIMTVLAALAQFERSQLIERITATNNYRRQQGAWVAGAVPIGLATEKRDKLRFLVRHPAYGDSVARAWPMILEGRSLADVASYLHGAGVPTTTARRKTVGRWARNAVSAVLKNRTYIGHLVSTEDFDRVRAVLGLRESPRNRTPSARPMQRPSERVWRLHGIARCALCGSALVGTTARGRSDYYPYLKCSGLNQRGRAFCAAKMLPAEAWEDAVVERVARFLSNPAAVRAELVVQLNRLLAETADMKERSAELERERDLHQTQLSRALELALQGGAVARAVGPRLAELQAKVEALDLELARIQGTLSAAETDAAGIEAIAEVLVASAANLPGRDWERQRAVLEHLVLEVRLASGVDGVIRMCLPTASELAREETVAGTWLVRTERREWLTTRERLRSGAIDLPLRVREYYTFPKRLRVEVL